MYPLRLIGIIALIISLASCKKDDNTNPPTSTNTTVQQGTWRITNFSEDGDDNTSSFTGYIFTFGSNGNVSIVNGTTTITGTWATEVDNSQDKFLLAFTTSPFDELTEDWRIIEQTNNKISLEHVSGGNGRTDLLTFEKN